MSDKDRSDMEYSFIFCEMEWRNHSRRLPKRKKRTAKIGQNHDFTENDRLDLHPVYTKI